MNIGDVADLSGLPAKTIRYYEDIGLVEPLRSANGYRSFRQSDVHKLAFLGRARALGFTIEDCRSLLNSMPTPNAPAPRSSRSPGNTSIGSIGKSQN